MLPVYMLDKRLLPEDSDRRCGIMTPKFITIHETSLGTDIRDTKGGTMYIASYYENVLNKPDERHVAYHYLVEANHERIAKVYQFLEPNVIAHHTGTEEGNSQSIGIERLVNTDTDMKRAIAVQALLTAELMKKYKIDINNVVPHKYWSGKECPARLLAGMYGGWDGFINLVKNYYIEISQIRPIPR